MKKTLNSGSDHHKSRELPLQSGNNRHFWQNAVSPRIKHSLNNERESHKRQPVWKHTDIRENSIGREIIDKRIYHHFLTKTGNETIENKRTREVSTGNGNKVKEKYFDSVTMRAGKVVDYYKSRTITNKSATGAIRSRTTITDKHGQTHIYSRTLKFGDMKVKWSASVTVSPLLLALAKKIKGSTPASNGKPGGGLPVSGLHRSSPSQGKTK